MSPGGHGTAGRNSGLNLAKHGPAAAISRSHSFNHRSPITKGWFLMAAMPLTQATEIVDAALE
jgi:hypothetical protein